MRPAFPLCWQERVNGKCQPQASCSEKLNALNLQVSQFYQTGRYGEAIPLAERYVDLAKNSYGEDHPIYETAIGWLATLYHAQGRFADAEPLYKRALSITKKRSAPTIPASPWHSTTWPSSPPTRAATPRPSRSTSAHSASAKRRWGRTIRMWPGRSTIWLRSMMPGPLRRGRAALQARTRIREKALGPDHPDVGYLR